MKSKTIIYISFLLCLTTCNNIEVDKIQTSVKIKTLNTSIAENLKKIEIVNDSIAQYSRPGKWELINTHSINLGNMGILYLKIYNVGNVKWGDIAGVLVITNKNNITWADTLSVMETEDFNIEWNKNILVVEKLISTISYHQYILIDTSYKRVIKSFDYDINYKYKEIRSIDKKLNCCFVNMFDNTEFCTDSIKIFTIN